MDVRIVGAQRRIDSLEAKARSAKVSEDLELQAQLARFLCVLSSGFIEQSVVAILEAYARSKSHARVANYVDQQLARLRNAKFEDILRLLGSFDPAWREHFQTNTSGEIKDAIDSIVNNRNQISHGQETGISLSTFSQYHKSVKTFISTLDSFIQAAS